MEMLQELEYESQDVPTLGQAQLILPDDTKSMTSLEEVSDDYFRKCKIICTMGPSCWDTDMLVKLIDAGMNVCRLNFSHGDHEAHGATVKRIREAAAQRPKKPVAILLDTKGPEIRTGFFREDVGKTIELEQGKPLKLTTDYSFKGDSSCFALSYDKLCDSVKVGNTILCADGSLSLKVTELGTDYVMTEVMNNCKLGERKNCNLPGVKVDLPVLQEKDKKDLLEFGIPHGVDFVAASFVQSADDVKMIREVLGSEGKKIKIISKIENEEGLKNFDAILEESDGIMVARGDLGMEIPPEKVFLAQKMMIARCNMRGKPVVTATQMLESMVSLPRPTRAEASDVANAVLDGSDCVMLSGETAGGKFPENAVTIMRRVCQEAEKHIDHSSLYLHTRVGVLSHGCVSSMEAIASSAVKTALDMTAAVILVVTESGLTAQIVAKYRPSCPILAYSGVEQTVRQLQCLRGVVPVFSDQFDGTDAAVSKALAWIKDQKLAKTGDLVVVVHGENEGYAEGAAAANPKKLHKRGSLIMADEMKPGASNLIRIVPVP